MTNADNSTSGTTIVVSTTSLGGVTARFAYEGNTPIQTLVRDLTRATGWNIEPVSMEIESETTKRSGGLGGGFKFGVAPKEGRLEFEKMPTEEVRIRGKVVWRKPDPEKE